MEKGNFSVNSDLERLLGILAKSLENAGREPTKTVELPVLYIVGSPRSGSTLCFQWLASSGAFGYPSNFISRFWKAPHVGAIIQEMITNPKYNYRDELHDIIPEPVGTDSDLGTTKGMLAPHRFWYFWRSIFPGDGGIGLDLSDVQEADFTRFREELHRLSEVFEKPLVMKGKIINHQMLRFYQGCPNALFLFMDRDPVDTAWSLLSARERANNDVHRWWSFKTPNYHEIKHLPPLDQVVAQIQAIRKDVLDALSVIPRTRSMRLDYRELLLDPEGSFNRVESLFQANGVVLSGKNSLTKVDAVSSRVPPDVKAQIQRALMNYPI